MATSLAPNLRRPNARSTRDPAKHWQRFLLAIDSFAATISMLALTAIDDDDLLLWLMRSLAILSALSAIVFVVQRFRSERLYADVVIQSAFVFWYLIPMVFWQGVDPDGIGFLPERAEVGTATGLVFFVKACFSASALLLPGRGDVFPLMPNLNRSVPFLAIVLFAALGLFPFVIASGGLLQNLLAGRADSAVFRQAQMNDGGPWNTLLAFTLHVACHLALLKALLEKNLAPKRLAIGSALILIVIICLSSGTRTMLLVMTMPALSVAVENVKIRFRHVARLVLVVITLVVVSEAMVVYRDAGITGLTEVQTGNVAVRLLTDNDFFTELVYNCALFPSVLPHSFESPMLIAAVNLVPRAWWPNKLDGQNSESFMRIRMKQPAGELMGNILPGIIGQYWQVAGMLGALILAGWLRLFAMFATRSCLSAEIGQRYLGFLMCWTVFIAFRNLGGGLLVPILLLSLAIWITESIFRAHGQITVRSRS